MIKKTQKTKQYVDKNPIESFKDSALDMGKNLSEDFWSQLLGQDKQPQRKNTSGDLSEGQELNLQILEQKTQKTESFADVMPGIDYRREIIHGEARVIAENQRELEGQVNEIMAELKRLINTSQELQTEFKEVAVQQRIVKPGKYHVNFFQWVLAVVKTARMKIEDSANWLSTFKSKKNKKQYWNMFKKHGTTFGMSNERVVATQTG